MEPSDTLHLVVSRLPLDAAVRLNGEPLTADQPGQFEVTGRLKDANRIEIECSGEATEEFPLDVRLGIVGHE